ncbi:MAG: BREX-1 system adenine-specific DNA-methyltransferase PglX [Gimesia sp.]
MNTNNIKRYAPAARVAFIVAVTERAHRMGITAQAIEPAIVSGDLLRVGNNHFPALLARSREQLVLRVEQYGFVAVMEQMAYTWFNRFCAIRFMELHDYLGHGFRVLSHPETASEFEILDHAQDVADDLGLERNHIIDLKLAGNKEEELYRTILLGQCHQLHHAMPFLFEALDDATELLMPDNLIRTDSLIRALVDGIPEEDWDQVEVIGWLYQFYIAEKKDQVIGKVVKSEDIPAATQLFTPNWIVRYLVQNSIGRQWMQTYPESGLREQMEYFIASGEQTPEVMAALATITAENIDPGKIKVLDPACGSGHILVEAYNILKAIYTERGFRNRDIPRLILEKNLFGLDIDDRAAQLAGFSLMMMARNDDRRIFSRNIKLNIVSLQESTHVDLPKLWRGLNLTGDWQQNTTQGLFGADQADLSSYQADNRYQLLQRTLERFEQAKTLGSLIDVPLEEFEPLVEMLTQLEQLQEGGDDIQKPAASALIPFVKQAWMLAQRYDSVVANPPYMGSKYQIPTVKKHLKDNFNGYEKDLFSAFIVRNLQLAKEGGQLGFMTPFVWMFISSYEKLRTYLIDEKTITSLIQLEYSGFDGATVPICTFTLENAYNPEFKGGYVRLSDFKGAAVQGPKALEIIQAANGVGK